MILLSDSGSTKTDWGLVENGKLIKNIRTRGMNPFQMSEEEIAEEIKTSLVPELPSTTIDNIYFYGAGCTPEKQPIVERALRANLTVTGVCEVASDMLVAYVVTKAALHVSSERAATAVHTMVSKL